MTLQYAADGIALSPGEYPPYCTDATHAKCPLGYRRRISLLRATRQPAVLAHSDVVPQSSPRARRAARLHARQAGRRAPRRERKQRGRDGDGQLRVHLRGRAGCVSPPFIADGPRARACGARRWMLTGVALAEHNAVTRYNPATGMVEPFIRDPAIQVGLPVATASSALLRISDVPAPLTTSGQIPSPSLPSRAAAVTSTSPATSASPSPAPLSPSAVGPQPADRVPAGSGSDPTTRTGERTVRAFISGALR